jgi:DNA-binding NarL/FixJ family response regulator
MISEPHESVRRMLARLVVRLGHEAVALDGRPTPAQLRSADILMVEPAGSGVSLAHTARAANPSVAILCAGVALPPAELGGLEPNLAGFVAKPFRPGQLGAAIQRALAHGERLSATP